MNILRVADEVWIATALLHRRHPDRSDFTVGEIVRQAEAEEIAGARRPSIQVHAYQHCVANKAPNPSRHRMLFEPARGRRRLFRPGDPYHPARTGRQLPDAGDIPPPYGALIDWYRNEYTGGGGEYAAGGDPPDPILSLRDSGAGVWADEGADSYVHRLREGWW